MTLNLLEIRIIHMMTFLQIDILMSIPISIIQYHFHGLVNDKMIKSTIYDIGIVSHILH